MAIVFEEKDSVFFVGGMGTKAGSASAGGCTKEFWGDLYNPSKELSDVMGTNGEPVSDAAAAGAGACDVVNNGSGSVRITKSGQGYFADCSSGLVVNVAFTAAYPNGRYEISAVDTTSGDWIDISLAYSADTTCSVYAGGAFDKLQNALDNTDANAASPHNVEILTNLDETFSDSGDKIDIDVGGGDITEGTWKKIIGIDDDGAELGEESYVIIDANNQTCHVFDISDLDNIEFRHIYAKGAALSCGFYIYGTANHFGYNLICCKSTGCQNAVKMGPHFVRNLFMLGGYYSAVQHVIYMDSPRYATFINVELVSAVAYDLIYGATLGHWVIDGCIFKKTTNYSGAVHVTNLTYPWVNIVLRNNVFYNIDDCIKIDTGCIYTRLFEYNNIYVLHTAATGKFIIRSQGTIAYSDYSCGWAVDGAPSAAVRWGGGGLSEHSIEQDPQFADAANGDFRPRNMYVLRGGKPDKAGNPPQMGAVLQKYQFVRRAKAANLGRLQIVR